MDEVKGRQALVEKLIELGTKATKPGVDESTRQNGEQEFNELVRKTGTFSLIPALNFLIQPGRVPPELRAKFMGVLTRIPLRPDGVRSTAEFVFSVHPSNTVSSSEAANPQKQGANITHEALNMAAKLIAYAPRGTSPGDWYQGIGPQLLALLDGKDGPELMKVAAYVIGFGILGRKQTGAPGTAGWKAVAEPILKAINPSMATTPNGSSFVENGSVEVVDLSKDIVLVTADQLAQGLFRLQALLISHPNPSLSKRLLHPVILPLWALASWIRPQPQCEERYCQPAQNLLRIYLKLATEPQRLETVVQNLLYKGNTDEDRLWNFEATSTGEIQVIKPRRSLNDGVAQFEWTDIDPKVDSLIELLKSVASQEDVSSIFTDLFSKWFSANAKESSTDFLGKDEQDRPDPVDQLTQIKVLQRMMDTFPSQLASGSDSILKMVEPILRQGAEKADDETVPVALSLLNLLVTAPSFEKATMDKEILQSIESSLDRLSRADAGDSSATARSLSLLLKYRDELDDPSNKLFSPNPRQLEDRKTYDLALSYITQLDSPPPVRAEGLNLLQTLIVGNSPVLDIPAALVLLVSLLQEDEDYIILRVVKIYTQLANKHPKTVTSDLLEHYVDAGEKASIDTRLRFGEALLQVIERLGETFTGETASQVAEVLLATAGRRGHRPKTEARQKKEERLRQMKQKRAEKEWGGEVPSLDDDDDDESKETEKDKADKELLTQIISGWDSKKGSEDIRIRASALSILAVGIETNVAGVGPTLVTASVDLSVNVLTMEPGPEAGILRRSAALVLLAFVRALNRARETGKRVGFGLTEESSGDIRRVLSYVAETDNDGLVRQHAGDVMESLDSYKLGSVVAEARTPELGLTRLAGLSVDPERTTVLADQLNSRPRIEEIE
ncbi:RNA polymerase II assembly factor RTP1 [Cytospora mali]|uniref:RNA polymerase II assembly factor RTP1 n=1 Tax=Cytospora mali TaxID=578113 RepID=A0A194VUV2_CYTMA|nr:RNA polymerase II assembly factor RTP1 [Valsa mali]